MRAKFHSWAGGAAPSKEKQKFIKSFTERFDLPRLPKDKLLDVLTNNQELLRENNITQKDAFIFLYSPYVYSKLKVFKDLNIEFNGFCELVPSLLANPIPINDTESPKSKIILIVIRVIIVGIFLGDSFFEYDIGVYGYLAGFAGLFFTFLLTGKSSITKNIIAVLLFVFIASMINDEIKHGKGREEERKLYIQERDRQRKQMEMQMQQRLNPPHRVVEDESVPKPKPVPDEKANKFISEVILCANQRGSTSCLFGFMSNEFAFSYEGISFQGKEKAKKLSDEKTNKIISTCFSFGRDKVQNGIFRWQNPYYPVVSCYIKKDNSGEWRLSQVVQEYSFKSPDLVGEKISTDLINDLFEGQFEVNLKLAPEPVDLQIKCRDLFVMKKVSQVGGKAVWNFRKEDLKRGTQFFYCRLTDGEDIIEDLYFQFRYEPESYIEE